MSKLVIAEKPMLARDIARAITGKEVSESARLPITVTRSAPAPVTCWNW
jgi:DNA topoisomerase-3